jgi:hypothetical protein
MATEQPSPLETLDTAVVAAQTALRAFANHQAQQKTAYEASIQKLIQQTEDLREENPRAKKLPLREGERTGYNMSTRLLNEATRECSPAEREFVLEFQSLLSKMFGPAGQ